MFALIDIPIAVIFTIFGIWLGSKYQLQGEALAKKIEADAAALMAKAAAVRAAIKA